MSYLSQSMLMGHWAPAQWGTLAGNLAMLQDWKGAKPGVWVEAYYDPVLWSLSYEWWFYLMFYAVAKWVRPQQAQKFLVGGASLAAVLIYQVAPGQELLFLMYFLIWWGGAEMSREYRRTGHVTFAGQKAMIWMLGVSAIVWAVPCLLWVKAGKHVTMGMHPFMEARHVTAALLLIIAGLVWQRWRWVGFAAMLGWCGVLAPISYGLYVFHTPVLNAFRDRFGVGYSREAVAVVAVGSSMLLAWLAEVRLQPVINRWSEPFLSSKRAKKLDLADVDGAVP